MKKQFFGFLLFFATAITGLCVPLVKEAFSEVPPSFFMSIRFALAFLVLFLIQPRAFVKMFKSDNLKPLILVSLSLFVGYLVYNYSMYFTSAINATFLYSLTMFIIPFVAKKINGTPYTPIIFLGAGMAFVGIFLLLGNGGTIKLGFGDILGIISAVLFSFQIVLSGTCVKSFEPIPLAAFQFAVVALGTYPVSLLVEGPQSLMVISPKSWLAIVLSALICTAGIYVVQNMALKEISESVTGIIVALLPLFTAVGAWFILGESLSTIGKIGGALMLAGVIVASRSNPEIKKKHTGSFQS